MSTANILNAGALIISSRVALESKLRYRVRDLQSPSRLAALLHGFLCCVALAEGHWFDAIQSSGLFFALDAALTFAIQGRVAWDTAFHHLLGTILCTYSVATHSFDESHVGSDLTRALILMETSNPLLHLLVTLRKEGWEQTIPVWILQVLQAIFLVQFAGIRIVLLGSVLYNLAFQLETTDDFQFGMFWISLSMWILQWSWFIKLLKARAK